MVNQDILAASITSMPDLLKLGVAGASDYRELITAVSNRNIGGSFVYQNNTPTRDVSLIRNPLTRRYVDYTAAFGDITAPRIGEAYDVYEREFLNIPVFLDAVGGLLGFYWDNGYKKDVFDTGGRLKTHDGTKNERRLTPVYNNVRNIYAKGIYGIQTQSLNESGDEVNVLLENGYESLKTLDDMGEYHPYLWVSGQEEPELKGGKVTLDVQSIDGTGHGTFYRPIIDGYGGAIEYGLYNEEEKYDGNVDGLFVIDTEENDAGTGLLKKTSEMFRNKKIGNDFQI